MEDPVLDGRHLTPIDHLDHFTQFARARVPVREIEMPAATDHIRVDEPGCGRDVAVPRPLGLIAVTLEAVFLGCSARLRAIPIWL